MIDPISEALKHWIPYKMLSEPGNDLCRWMYVGNKEFTEPFFGDTIVKCKQFPENSWQHPGTSSIDLLPEWATHIDFTEPTAFIFHISRCGSTLISQLLSLSKGTTCLSEVPFFDEILRNGRDNWSKCLPILKAAICFYSVKRAGTDKSLFIKTDSWHIHFYEQLRQLFPLTPFIFLYRKPDEVIRSQQKQRGMQAVPGLIEPEIFQFNKQEILQLDLDEYMAKVMESFLEAFIQIMENDKLVLAVNYNEGPLPIVKKIAAFSKLVLDADVMEKMEARCQFHAKDPGKIFEETQPDQPVPGFLQRAFDLYDQLEIKRVSQAFPCR